MVGKRIRLFKLFNFKVYIDISWVFIALLVTWSLAFGYFPYRYRWFSPITYLWMGVFGALGLFASIVFHELCHSLVARKFSLSIRGITLFVFGGVAEMDEEPPNAKAEFFMAIAGPISSIFLGFVFYVFYRLGASGMLPYPVNGVFRYLSWINWVLAGFNLVPAFPLDGGRILRSALWHWKKDLRWATRISTSLGSAFGVFLSLCGVFYFFMGAFMAGLWYFLIGMFLQGAAHMSYQRLLMTRALEGESIQHFMKPKPITVPSSINIQSLVEDYVYKYHFKFFPVVKNGKLLGCISTQEIKQIPREKWSQYQVAQVLKPCSPENAVMPDTDATKVLSLMHQTNKSRMMVVEGEKLLGIITLKDLLKFISLKMELEGEFFKEKI